MKKLCTCVHGIGCCESRSIVCMMVPYSQKQKLQAHGCIGKVMGVTDQASDKPSALRSPAKFASCRLLWTSRILKKRADLTTRLDTRPLNPKCLSFSRIHRSNREIREDSFISNMKMHEDATPSAPLSRYLSISTNIRRRGLHPVDSFRNQVGNHHENGEAMPLGGYR